MVRFLMVEAAQIAVPSDAGGVASVSIRLCGENARSPKLPWRADYRLVCTGFGARDGTISGVISSARSRASSGVGMQQNIELKPAVSST